jgi:soluble lytic murein transglycosylase-like protein
MLPWVHLSKEETEMILTRPIEISAACLLRTTFFIGAAFAIFLSPQQLAHRQWMDAPAGVSSANLTAPSPVKIEEYISQRTIRAEKELHNYILIASQRHRIDPALVKAVILAESGYDANAVSPKGAKGLMQLMPVVLDSFGIEDAFDPIHNINGGVKYLSQLLKYFGGNLYLSLAAYNAGIGRVMQPRPIPSATRQYVLKVLEFYEYYQSGVWGRKKGSEDC